ncbi:MAG: hypothetical protein SFZ23_05585 [Planctomycetota bacterium]|nr:hypothetical protein [Planctomycetota bacterium]
MDDPVMWVVIAAILILGPVFTYWWWKIADRWADAEHRRFRAQPDQPLQEENRVVIRDEPVNPPPPAPDAPKLP